MQKQTKPDPKVTRMLLDEIARLEGTPETLHRAQDFLNNPF